MRRIIVISGKQGSGKTTCSEILKKIFIKSDFIPKTIKFADPLYEMHSLILPVAKKYGIRPVEMDKDGELLQLLGTEWGRKIHPNIWAKICRERADEWVSQSEKHIAIIDDARFENEIDFFNDALLVRLTAPKEVRKQRCHYWRENDSHPSEVGLDHYEQIGKFSGQWAVKYSTEFTRPDVTAQDIFNHLDKGYRF